MRNYELPEGPLATLAKALIFGGLVLNILLTFVLHATPWIGLTPLVAGVLLSVVPLFRQQWGSKQR